MDKVEQVARILARTFGYGTAWEAHVTSGADTWMPEAEGMPAAVRLTGSLEDDAQATVSDGLPVCRETETVERAGDSVSAWIGRQNAPEHFLTATQRRARAKLTPERCAELWAWEAANPLNLGQRGNPHSPREFEHWQRTQHGAGVHVARPQVRLNESALVALAALAKPLQATLLLYALGEERHWTTAQRYARACLPGVADDDIAEGMLRLLTEPSKRQRAKERTMRETEWDTRSLPALRLFESWLERAAAGFMQRLEGPEPITGSQGDGLPAETWWHPERLSADVRGGPFGVSKP